MTLKVKVPSWRPEVDLIQEPSPTVKVKHGGGGSVGPGTWGDTVLLLPVPHPKGAYQVTSVYSKQRGVFYTVSEVERRCVVEK